MEGVHQNNQQIKNGALKKLIHQISMEGMHQNKQIKNGAHWRN